MHTPDLIEMLTETPEYSVQLRAKLLAYVVAETNGFERSDPPFKKLLPMLFEESRWAAVADAVPFIVRIKPHGMYEVVDALISPVLIDSTEGFDPCSDQAHYVSAVVLGIFEAANRPWSTTNYDMKGQLDKLLVYVITTVAYARFSASRSPLSLSAAEEEKFEQRLGSAIKEYIRSSTPRKNDRWPSFLQLLKTLQEILTGEVIPHPIVGLVAEQFAYAAFGSLTTAERLEALSAWRVAARVQ